MGVTKNQEAPMKKIEKEFLEFAKEFDVRVKRRDSIRTFMYLKKQDRLAETYEEIVLSKPKTTMRIGIINKHYMIGFLKGRSGYSMFVSCDEDGSFINTTIKDGVVTYHIRYAIGRLRTKYEKLNILAKKRIQKL